MHALQQLAWALDTHTHIHTAYMHPLGHIDIRMNAHTHTCAQHLGNCKDAMEPVSKDWRTTMMQVFLLLLQR